MGEWKKPTTFKLSEKDVAMLREIQDALSPLVENASQTVRWMIATMHMLIFKKRFLDKVFNSLSELKSETPSSKGLDSPITTPKGARRSKRGV